MKSIWQRVLVCILASAIVIITMSACGKDGSDEGTGLQGTGTPGDGTPVTAGINKNLVFKEKEIDLTSFLKENNGNITTASIIGDRIFLAGSKWNSNIGNAELFTLTLDMDGGNPEFKQVSEPSTRTVDYIRPVFDEEGNVYTLKIDHGEYSDDKYEQEMPTYGAKGEEDAEANTSEDASATDDADTAEGEASASTVPATVEGAADDTLPDDEDGFAEQENPEYFLMKFDKEGNTVFETELNPADFVNEGEWFGVYNMYYTSGQGIILQTETGLFLCSADDGTFVRQIYKAEQGNYAEFCISRDGTIYLYSMEDGYVLKELNIETGDTGSDIILPEALTKNGFGSGALKPGKDTDFLVVKPEGISTWNVGEATAKDILSNSDSDLSMQYPETLLAISDTRFFVTYSGQDMEGTYRIFTSFLDKVNPEDVTDKKVLTIGVLYLDSSLRNSVFAFNKQSSKYKIKIIDYSQFDSKDNWELGSGKFVTDIATGNAPDLMFLDPSMPIQSFAAKGLFEPLDEYLANDSEISQREYVTSVPDAFKYKDTTYMLVPSFSVYTYAMKKKEADQLTQWDMKTLDKMMTDRGLDYAIVFGYPMDQQNFLQMCLTFDAGSFMDWSSGEAKFNTPQFIDLLNFTKKMPESVDDWNDADGWRELESAFRNDKAIVSQVMISNYRQYAQLRHATFGEDISFVGFPRTEGAGGAAAAANAMIAMNSRSPDKEGCWEFMRGFYLDGYQNLIVKNDWQLPIAKKQLDEMAEKAMHRPYYMENDKKVEFDDTYYINGKELIIPPMTQAEVDFVNGYFDSIDTVACYDRKVFNIISEESAPFFKGQKTAEECAQIIQSKLQLYMDENNS